MSAFKEERLMQVLLAPQISEKATYIADKNEQVVFRVASDATKPEVKAKIRELKLLHGQALEDREREKAALLRHRISRLKKISRRVAQV